MPCPKFFRKVPQKTKSLIVGHTNFKSTKTSRRGLRASGTSELFSLVGTTADYLAAIAKFAQFIFSIVVCTRQTPRSSERILSGLLASIAVAQFFLILVIYWYNEVCDNRHDSNLCKAYNYLDWAFIGLLISGMLPSEFSKRDETSAMDVTGNDASTIDEQSTEIELDDSATLTNSLLMRSINEESSADLDDLLNNTTPPENNDWFGEEKSYSRLSGDSDISTNDSVNLHLNFINLDNSSDDEFSSYSSTASR